MKRGQLALAAVLPILLYAIFGAMLLQRKGGDLSRLVVAGDAFVDRASAPPCLAVEQNSAGYDGQFYYRLAVAQAAFGEERVAGVRFDFPVYRQQRIGYPLLASIVALGDPFRAIVALPLVNLLGVGAIGFFAALLLAQRGLPPVLGALAALYPGLLLTFARDTTEIVCVAFLLLGAWLLTRDRPLGGALAFAFAALTRETALVGAAIVFVASLVERRAVILSEAKDPLLVSRRGSFASLRMTVRWLLAAAIPFVAFLAWKLFLFRAWNLPVNFGSSGVFTAPFAGIASVARNSWPATTHMQRVQLLELALLVLFAIVWGAVALTRRAPLELRLMSAAYFAFAVILSSTIWVEDWAYLRATSDFGVLALLVALHAPARARAFVIALAVAGWLALAWDVTAMR